MHTPADGNGMYAALGHYEVPDAGWRAVAAARGLEPSDWNGLMQGGGMLLQLKDWNGLPKRLPAVHYSPLYLPLAA